MNNCILRLVTFPAVLLSVLASAAFAAPTTFADAVLAGSPIAYWRFGEAPGAATAVDAMGAHHGSYSASGIVLGAPGIRGGDTGALFLGTVGVVSVPNHPALGPDFITMEALVRWDGPDGFQQRILEKSFFAGGEQASYSLSILEGGEIRVEVRSGGFATVHTTAEALATGDEAYIVGTFDGSAVSIYLDGTLLQTTLAAPGALQDGINPLGIGSQTERSRPFKGLIDELALYDHALSAAEIGAHFGALSVAEPGSLALFGLAMLLLARRRVG